MQPYLKKYKARVPTTQIEWELWRESNKVIPDEHIITEEMANEYYDWMDGKRRYLSFKDTITQGQLDRLRILYEFHKDQALYAFIEQEDPVETKWKEDQVFHMGKVPPKPVKAKQANKPRKTKWTRTRHHGVLQLKLRNYDN